MQIQSQVTNEFFTQADQFDQEYIKGLLLELNPNFNFEESIENKEEVIYFVVPSKPLPRIPEMQFQLEFGL